MPIVYECFTGRYFECWDEKELQTLLYKLNEKARTHTKISYAEILHLCGLRSNKAMRKVYVSTKSNYSFNVILILDEVKMEPAYLMGYDRVLN